MDFWNFFAYVNYLHQEHIELKHKYITLLSLISQELPGMNARLKALEQQNLKVVRKKTHQSEKRISCQYCGENFDEMWKLETHLVKHEEAEQFPCIVCSKTFQTKWRLDKHLKNHERKNLRVCKYFQKGQYCPFEKVGCKFLHCSSRNKKEVKQFSDDESADENCLKNDTITIGGNKEKEFDYKNDKLHCIDCQGCGQFPFGFECVECGGKYCSECVLKDHIKNLHYCLNCGDEEI